MTADRTLFRQLLRPELPRLYRLACRLTSIKVDAEELFQDVITRIYARIGELDSVDRRAPWLARVMYNHFIDNRRRYLRDPLRLADETALPGGSLEAIANTGDNLHDVVWREQLQVLGRALGMLAEDQRIAVLLHDAEGYTLAEIQAITGVPPGTVKSRLHRGRQRLRELLPDDGSFS